MRTEKRNVAVVFGGRSCENEISVITGTMTANVIDRNKYNPIPVYLSQEGEFYTGNALFDVAVFRGNFRERSERAIFSGGKLYTFKGRRLRGGCKIDCIVNCCHGLCGEDGAVAALADLNDIANASPDILGSAVFMDKAATKLVAKALGVKTPAYFKICRADYEKRSAMAIKFIEARLGYPVVVKPARQGSSIGVFVAEDRAKLTFAIQSAFAFDGVIIAEKYIRDRREINCAAYRRGSEIVLSECEEPKTDNKILTFSDKYLSGGAKEHVHDFPADLPKAQSDLIKGYTKLLYRRLNLRGVVRADFLVSGEDVYFNEMNTVPGSLAYYLFSDRFADFSNLLSTLIEQGISDHIEAQGRKMLKNCGVLASVSPRGKKR